MARTASAERAAPSLSKSQRPQVSRAPAASTACASDTSTALGCNDDAVGGGFSVVGGDTKIVFGGKYFAQFQAVQSMTQQAKHLIKQVNYWDWNIPEDLK